MSFGQGPQKDVHHDQQTLNKINQLKSQLNEIYDVCNPSHDRCQSDLLNDQYMNQIKNLEKNKDI